MPDAIFAHPRLAAVYDALDPDRSDLDAYVAMVSEFGARRVLDVGCGTGTLACRLAAMSDAPDAEGAQLSVVGVDPAAASLDVARGKPGAERVRWVHGTVADVADEPFDLVVMTGNVAQVFVHDDQWSATLRRCHGLLRPGGRLVFETRVPARRAWEGWTRGSTHQVVDVPGVGEVEDWTVVTRVDEGDPLTVTFQSPTVFRRDGERIDSTSTLVFRRRGAIETELSGAGFTSVEVRDAPDRPGLEWVFVAVAH